MASNESSETFVSNIKQWSKINEEIQELTHLIRIKNAQRKELSCQISNTMKSHNIGNIDVTGGKIKHAVRTTKSALTKKILAESLLTHPSYKDGGEDIVDDVVQHVLSARSVVSKDIITFTKGK